MIGGGGDRERERERSERGENWGRLGFVEIGAFLVDQMCINMYVYIF